MLTHNLGQIMILSPRREEASPFQWRGTRDEIGDGWVDEVFGFVIATICPIQMPPLSFLIPTNCCSVDSWWKASSHLFLNQHWLKQYHELNNRWISFVWGLITVIVGRSTRTFLLCAPRTYNQCAFCLHFGLFSGRKRWLLPGFRCGDSSSLVPGYCYMTHVLFVYISAYFRAERGGCYLASDAVTHQASFRGIVIWPHPQIAWAFINQNCSWPILQTSFLVNLRRYTSTTNTAIGNPIQSTW
jgi:hypothetical protein